MSNAVIGRSIGLVAAASVALACGGRVDVSESGSGNAPGSGASGGSANGSGGVRASGGTSAAGRKGSGATSGAGAVLTGTCNPSFCQSQSGVVGCCVGPNGPCGLDFGNGCIARGPQAGCQSDAECPPPPVPCQPCPDGTCAPAATYCSAGSCVTSIGGCTMPPPSCDPAFCAHIPGGGKPCCVTPNGPCGLDYGMGCGPSVPPPPPPPPPMDGPSWQKGCVPDLCRDGGEGVPLCDPGQKELAGYACSPPGKTCAVTYGCSPLIMCGYSGCMIPL